MAPSDSRPAGKNSAKISVLGLAMLNIVAVVSLSGLPAEAEYGLSAAFYYVFAAVFFLVPVSLVAAELATGWPEKGGVFRWVGEAFGARWGFVSIFLLLAQVTIFFPVLLTFGAISLAYTGPEATLDEKLSGNRLYILLTVLAVFWVATAIGAHGIAAFTRVAKWGGIVGTILPALLLVILGLVYLSSGGQSQTPLGWGEVVPDFARFSNLALAASIFLFYAGMEMNAIHVRDVENPTRHYPLAVLIAAVGAMSILVLGTLTISFVVPRSEIDLTQSLLITFLDVFRWLGLAWAVPIVAVALVIGVLAGIVTWVVGPSTAMLAVAKAGYLPPFFQLTNKYGMPTRILLFQAISVSVLAVLFIVMPSVEAAFQVLSQLAGILYLLIYLGMFAAAIQLRYSQPDRRRPYRVPGGLPGMWVIGGIGFVASALALASSLAPPDQIGVGSPTVYIGLLVGLAAMIIAVPLSVYVLRKPDWCDPGRDVAPFSWETQGDR
ncbi:putative glutamine/gamma-aminobutyrate antiporter GadC [Salinispora sp. H7-4]|uniref:putative glutamine/gamma-aminobutyrate antiporter GadC n=1 Tax=Salinispora sp. H7-4 TaxID=2748321 RepID=UPI0015D385B5|nr:putative glutamine/gamma-aminobutyrate antiporter GadC [Salinispora sp. H7-4]NYT92467.1 amino acid permease [Salinispora sp. H7-4]